jgi:hypothetical protein
MKMKYGHWIASIPTITTDQLFTLNPATSASGQAYKIASPNSATQFYIVEYRRKTGPFENSLPKKPTLAETPFFSDDATTLGEGSIPR